MNSPTSLSAHPVLADGHMKLRVEVKVEGVISPEFPQP